jgi:hypothetical protein
VTGRESVFGNPVVIRTITEHFVPVAEDVTGLQQADDEHGRFFRHVAVQGRMKGRSRPDVSHQGIYAFAPDGTTLSSGNPLEAEGTLTLLEEATRRWAEYAERPDAARPHGLPEDRPRDVGYPADGAVLRVSVRDLPRPAGSPVPPDQARYFRQWNFDHVWLRADQARAFLPERLETGEKRAVPSDIVSRVARYHLRDVVRGEPRPWGPDAVERADLTTTVTARDGDRVTISFDGHVLLREHVAFRDSHKPIDWEFDNELDAAIGGDAEWDAGAGQFTRFDMVVAGQRTGAHRYNVRTHDPGPAPIGFAFELAGDQPWERTPPHVLRTWTRPGETEVPVATTVTGEPYYGERE